MCCHFVACQHYSGSGWNVAKYKLEFCIEGVDFRTNREDKEKPMWMTITGPHFTNRSTKYQPKDTGTAVLFES